MKILKLIPAVKDYIWGGTRLSKEFDILSFTDKQAEAWVLSCHDDGENIISGGAFDGRTLKDVLENEGRSYLGTNCKKFDFFPILIKLIDAKDNLSLQVHPSDEYALKYENQYGKTEAWYIIDCDEGAEIIYGLKEELTKEELKEMIDLGETITLEVSTLNDDILTEIGRLPHVMDVNQTNNLLTIKFSKGSHNLLRLLDLLKDKQISFGNIHSEQPTLNDVFLTITGRELRD